ncbi:hypothetical protein DEFDS_P188 (plasmid) [Deferribacter desulfuricans SSM1]|uniref:Uncharacterized protein n=1 Tax=Deferribacter desulfuricans (strain DSM 14783 / JCM 11476 / NBRC 101012 / SSM1) TaxID=639282 RepID=D3PF16_DEFDS|nr:hypothetical protein [Deferribacter desulfuricans]BAI81808.1 hypothetical protein DEFDS_P188 [Deferribacter desulfuricans SSM1]
MKTINNDVENNIYCSLDNTVMNVIDEYYDCFIYECSSCGKTLIYIKDSFYDMVKKQKDDDIKSDIYNDINNNNNNINYKLKVG